MTDIFAKFKALSMRLDGSSGANPDDARNPRDRGSLRRNQAEPTRSRFLTRIKGASSQASKPTKEPPSSSPQTPRSQPSKPKPPIYQRWWVWVLLGLGASAGGAVVSAYDMMQTIEGQLPDSADALTFARNGTLTIKAADGVVLQQLGPATRNKLTFDQIPTQLVEAFLASEDKNFYQHNGVDYQAIARALMANITAGEVVEGGSTITQQVARIVFLDQDRSIDRKAREALLAQKLERDLTKDQIIERYLNLVYLGSGAYGVADAAWIYFSKTVDELTLPEIAMIAGLPPAPSVFSPLVNLDIAQDRRDLVLQRMVDVGYITEAQKAEAIAAPINLNPSLPLHLYSDTPYFTSYVQQQLPTLVSPDELEQGGLTVETTMNLQFQQLAQDTIADAIDTYGPGQNFSQASMVVIDPATGEIKAMVGGNDFNESQFNRVTQAMRQPGSTFKSLVYATAIAAGFSPYKSYVDEKLVVDGYEPQNYGKTYRGGVTMRDALASSINVVAVKVLIDVGFQPVIDLARRMGITTDLQPTYSLALGAYEVNLLDLTSAYGTLAARGNHVTPHSITRIIDRYGDVIYEADFQPERALDEDSAAIVTWMLRAVVTNGTGGRAALPDHPVAGKTGTSEERRDLWFIGYIPQLVTGVWLGHDDDRPTWGASSTAARVWRNFMVEAVEDIPVEQFPELPRVEGRRGSITAQPVKPRRVSNRSEQNPEEQSERRQRSSDNTPETSRPNPVPEESPETVVEPPAAVIEPAPEPVAEPAPAPIPEPIPAPPVIVPVEPVAPVTP